MEENRKPRSRRKSAARAVAPLMSQRELARLGGGHIAYIKVMTMREAREMFPTIEGIPEDDGSLFALHAADGTPIALTDSHQAAVGHAMEGELEVRSLH